MSQPFLAEKPYPSISDLSHNAYDARVISSAYATPTGALNAALQYFYHGLCFGASGKREQAQKLRCISAAKMVHLQFLGEALAALGAQPIFSAQPPASFRFYSTVNISCAHTLRNMIEDDIRSEKYALRNYNRMLSRIRCQSLKDLISRFTEDNELHLSALQEILIDLCET